MNTPLERWPGMAMAPRVRSRQPMASTTAPASSAANDSAFFNNLVTRKVDGAVLLGRFPRDLYSMIKNSIPRIVYCGLNYIDDNIPQVVCDATRGIEHAVNYLVRLGHKRIGFIGETNRDQTLINEWRFHKL